MSAVARRLSGEARIGVDYGEYFMTWPGWDGSGAATSADGDFLVLPRTTAVLVAYLYVTSYGQQAGPRRRGPVLETDETGENCGMDKRGLFGSNATRTAVLCRTMEHGAGRDRAGARLPRVGASRERGWRCDGAQDRRC